MIRWLVSGLAALARLLRPRTDPTVMLAGLSDHMLADIGLRRDQIPSLALGGDPRALCDGRPRAEDGQLFPVGAAPRPSRLTLSSSLALSGVDFTEHEPGRSSC